MRFSLSIILLAFFLLTLVASGQDSDSDSGSDSGSGSKVKRVKTYKTVYIHKSCEKDQKEWKDYWFDFRNFSERGLARMQSTTDVDYNNVFGLVMQAPKSSGWFQRSW
jgi:phage terminase large subunit-like protein